MKSLKIGLHVKVAIGVIVLIALAALLMSLFFISRQKQVIHQSLKDKGLALASNAAYNAEYGVLSGNSLILKDLIEGIMQQPDVGYSIIQDLNGNILASKGLNKQLLGSVQYKQASKNTLDIENPLIQLICIHGMDYYDISVPIITTQIGGRSRENADLSKEGDIGYNKKIGVVRVGLLLENAATLIKKTMLVLAMITLLIIVIASLLAMLLIRIALLPIRELVQATERISRGDFTSKVSVSTKDEIGELAYSFNKMVRDLQDSTVSVKSLRKEEKRFSDIANNSGDWIWETDKDGRYVYTNRVVEKVLGYKPEEVLGRRFYDFFIPIEQEEMKKAVFDSFSKKEAFHNFLNRNFHKDGHIVILETSAIPLISDDGELIGYRGAYRDVTDRERVEKEREEMLIKLKERQELLERQKRDVEDSRRAIKNVAEDLMESKGILEKQKISLEAINKELDDFTYIVSHDLKEPLRSIDAYSKFVIDDYKDKLGEEGKRYLERVRANAERMKKLIEDLLNISRLKKRSGVIEEASAKELVNEAIMMLEYAIKQKKAEVSIKTDLPKIFCDKTRLTEVFVNLISNAIKFNDRPDIKVEIGYEDKGNMHQFYVKDNGIGIKEEYFDKIFEIFQRLGKKEDAEGTGAGLAIAKKIVQLHRGDIWLRSKTGEGSIFYFTISKEKALLIGKN